MDAFVVGVGSQYLEITRFPNANTGALKGSAGFRRMKVCLDAGQVLKGSNALFDVVDSQANVIGNNAWAHLAIFLGLFSPGMISLFIEYYAATVLQCLQEYYDGAGNFLPCSFAR